ncbi:glycosyltransferase [Hymenobacter sp. BT491]|uniref:glycosyltransferase n=1 Tax=Hymenobacter sp. BT491 TaxID=2766779 RepID=UPI0016537D68|nr:glycosyltransferase [Hymenobacter sp. BT491]MBC6988288.1 hypothetical protein [Hymenobacter sp. BT491]
MISIIICSRENEAIQKLSSELAINVGVPFELVVIDNKDGRYNIFQAYNLGISNSKYDILCFMHEDISIKTADWGQVIKNLFDRNQALGLVGVAGSSYKPVIPSGWASPVGTTIYSNVLQHIKKTGEVIHNLSNPKHQSYSKVVAVDGVWFCTKREVVNKVAFDEATFAGFHCYDVDFSLSVYQKFEVAVTFDILIEHFSEGSFDKKWIGETIKLHEKWGNYLPINSEGISKQHQRQEEKGAFYYMLNKMIDTNYIDYKIYQILWKKNIISLVDIVFFMKMNYHITKAFVKILFSGNKVKSI